MRKFIKRYSEVLTIPLAFVIWFVFQWVAKVFNLHTYGNGIFQKLIFAFIAVLIINGLVWWLLKINFPYLKKFLDSDHKDKWVKLNEKTQMHFSTWLFSLYFLAFVLIVALI